jgi:uncharacterized protein (TIGR03435 family)
MKELPQLLRSLLADRFKLKTHTESRELPLYDLVLARSDGRLGPDLKPSTSDCSKADELAASRARRWQRATWPASSASQPLLGLD